MLFKKIGIIDENFDYKENMYVGVEKGKIDYIGPKRPPHDYGEEYDGKGRLLMSGFFNAHAHSPMALLRGYAENMKLQDWLFKRVFPFEAKLTGNSVYWGTLLCMAESLRFGIVSTSDMYYFMTDMGKAVLDSGCKANISRAIVSIDGSEDFDHYPSVEELKVAAKVFNGADNGRIKIDASLHAEYTSNQTIASRLADLTKEMGLNMQVHVAETKDEFEECKERHEGRTPIQYLADCGILDPVTTAAHCVWLADEDYEILREKQVTVATNPSSNLKLDSGICDVARLLKEEINVAIGTDSVSSNNNLDFLQEIRTMALASKVRADDPTVITPKQALYAATRAGAEAQGRLDTGLLKQGYKADLIVMRTDVPNMHPVHNMLNNIVFSATGADIVMTMVDGNVLYRDGEYKTIDICQAIEETEKATQDILDRL